VRKVKDYYFNKAKQDNYPARSVYKLEEAQEKYNFLRKGDVVLDLGCQPGSWSMYAARIVGPQGLVVGVDLKEGKNTRITGAAEIIWLCQDITAVDTMTVLQGIATDFQVVLSDMAPRTTGNKWVDQQQSLRLARRSLEIAEQLLGKGGNYYCKVFQGEDVPEFIDDVRGHFQTTRTVKPKSSRTESREVFILGMDYLK
jgi:23S rRNA (uridine2552-2'-O)-methyltransferase